MPSRILFGITRERSPGVAFSVGTMKLFLILFYVDLCPMIRSPNLWTITPPPSIFESLAMDSP